MTCGKRCINIINASGCIKKGIVVPATIKDIAKKVGVSTSTVSRALTGRATISEETRRRISQAVEELNYHPNAIARNLANGIARTVCLLIDASEDSGAFSNAFFTNSVFGIEKAVQKCGYDLLITGCFDGKVSKTLDKLILERKTDGIIIPPSLACKSVLDKLIGGHIPFVVLGEPQKQSSMCSWVDINNSQGGMIAAQHLLDNGYERLAFFGGKETDGFVQRRLGGFIESLETNGRKAEEVSFLNDEHSAIDVLSSGRFDGFVCIDNFAAFEILKAAKTLNLDVPNDVGVVTFDNYPIAPYMDPPLSCIDIDTLAQGAEATRILINQINGSHPQQSLISTELIERASSRRVKV